VTLLLAGTISATVAGAALGEDAADLRADRKEANSAIQALYAERETAAAEAERDASAGAFADQTATRALTLARRHFDDFIDVPAWDPLGVRSSAQVERFVGDYGAILVTPTGRRVAVESTMPVRSDEATGRKAPVDLTLEDTGDALEPANPLIGVELPKDLADGVAFEGGFSLDVGGGDAAAAKVVEDKAFYANALNDTDVILQPVPGGLEVALQVRSAAAPERLPLDFDLPAGTRLELLGDGGAELVRAGKRIATISPPEAFDAERVPLTASYAVDGDRLVIDFPHRGQEVLYPALVDPQVDSWAPDGAGNVDFSQWPFSQSWTYTGFYSDRTNRIYVSTWPNAYYGGNDWGQFTLQAPRTSWISRVTFNATHSPSGHYPQGSCVLEGVWSVARGVWESGTYVTSTGSQSGPSPWNGGSGTATNTNSCWSLWGDVRTHTLSTVSAGNMAVFRLSANGTAVRPTSAAAASNAISIELNDPDPPRIDQNTISRSGWLANNVALTHTVQATDPGLGMYAILLKVPRVGGGTADQTAYGTCAGGHVSQCVATKSWSFGYNTSTMPEGVNNVTGTVSDMLGKTASFSQSVKVDKTAPTGAISGSLRASAGTALRATTDLHVTASDGSTAVPASGVKSLELLVDGARRGYKEQQCSAASCAMTFDTTLDSSAMAAGAHTVVVRAVDQVGNTANLDTWTVYAERSAPRIVTGGSLYTGDAGSFFSGRQALKIQARDDAAGPNPQSGSASVQLTLDGVVVAQGSSPSCVGTACVAEAVGQAELGQLADGSHQVAVTAADQAGNRSSQAWDIRVDNHGPAIQLSGALYPGTSGVHTVAAAHEALGVSATDGDVMQPQSGVANTVLYVDDREFARADGATEEACVDSCPLSSTFDFDAGTVSPGEHTVRVASLDRLGNLTSRSWTISVPATYAGEVCRSGETASPGVPVPSGDLVTPATALQELETHTPTVVDPSVATQVGSTTIDPTVVERSDTVASAGTIGPAEVSDSLYRGVSTGDTKSPICLTPVGVASNASAPILVGDAAVLTANSQRDVDTVVRPTAAGVESFVQIRSADAPTSFSWKVDLEPGQQLVQVSPELVAVVAPPSAAAPDMGAVPADAGTGDPQGDTDIDDDLEMPTTPEPPPPTDTTPPTLSEQVASVPDAEVQLTDADAAVADAQAAVDGEVVGAVSAPWAIAASGARVPLQLSASGATITMVVSHLSFTAYPVVAGPQITKASVPVQAAGNYRPGTAADMRDCFGSSPCGRFDADEAAAYIRRYAARWNDKYEKYGANDCTNFASQGLRAGGVQFMREYWTGQGSWWTQLGRYRYTTESWRLVAKLKTHLSEYGLAHQASSWHVGDLVFFDWRDGGASTDHVATVTGFRNGAPLIGSHGGNEGSDKNYAGKPLSEVRERARRQHGKLPSYEVWHIDHSQANIS
jgi:hypothetical protein